MYAEILQHSHFCKNFVRQFKGRDELIKLVVDYVKDEKRNQPFILYGPSGSGKSSIMAKLAVVVIVYLTAI